MKRFCAVTPFIALLCLLLLGFTSNSFATEQTYQFTLPSKVQITIIEAPFGTRPASACPGYSAKLRGEDYRPKTYVKSIRARFKGNAVDLDVTCMTDAWNGRPLQTGGAIRYFGGWCNVQQGRPYCAFRGVFSDASESFVAEWYASGNTGKRTVFSGSSDVVSLFIKNIDPPEHD